MHLPTVKSICNTFSCGATTHYYVPFTVPNDNYIQKIEIGPRRNPTQKIIILKPSIAVDYNIGRNKAMKSIKMKSYRKNIKNGTSKLLLKSRKWEKNLRIQNLWSKTEMGFLSSGRWRFWNNQEEKTQLMNVFFFFSYVVIL